MGSFSHIARRIWRSVPRGCRDALTSIRWFDACRVKLKTRFRENALHDDIYDKSFYDRLSRWDERNFLPIASSIMGDLKPSSVLDVGCGAGALLQALQAKGAKTVCGVELSSEALDLCREKGLAVKKCDLSNVQELPFGRLDVVTCFEVAEHLPPEKADTLTALLVQKAPCIVFTAAHPSQGGVDHLNEQPKEYWIERFQSKGYTLNRALTDKWAMEWQDADVLKIYTNNLMIFTAETGD